uniref:Uncharacterized protein n=1 Tax=Caenorhabditis tropicalis TaxID=1561998 RepID=A0A1I7TPB4_9PELO
MSCNYPENGDRNLKLCELINETLQQGHEFQFQPNQVQQGVSQAQTQHPAVSQAQYSQSAVNQAQNQQPTVQTQDGEALVCLL